MWLDLIGQTRFRDHSGALEKKGIKRNLRRVLAIDLLREPDLHFHLSEGVEHIQQVALLY